MSGFLTGRTVLSSVDTAQITADAVTSAKIADDQIDSEHYAAASIDTAHIGDDQVTPAKMAGGTLDVGFDTTAVADGTKTTGTYTLVYTGGNMKTATNGGAHPLAPQTSDGTIVVQYTNNASAGSLTTSGYDTVNGDSLTTTNGHDFMLYSTVVGSFQHLHVVALQ